MKKILISILTIGVITAGVYGFTQAFFSDTETSTDNTFQAGSIDLLVKNEGSYNLTPIPTWGPKDIDTIDKFFNFTDVKPGDSGENTITLRVNDNDSWLCMYVDNVTNAENSCNEPEKEAEPACDQDTTGELQMKTLFTIWRDNGTGDGVACDNVQNGREPTLFTTNPAKPKVPSLITIADYNTGTPLTGGTDNCIGVSWNVPTSVGNEIQSDSLTANVSFYTVQSRNNLNFTCPTTMPTEPTPAFE